MSISRLAFAGGLVALFTSGLFGAAPVSAAPSEEATTAIDQRFAEFGGATSRLGEPTGAATDIAGGAERDYAGGTIFYSPETGAKVMYGGIRDKFRELGGPAALGFPKNDESPTSDGSGRFNEFATPGGAAIYWTSGPEAWLVQGQVLDAWNASGGVEGPFGYPTADTAVVNGVETGQFAGPGGTEISWSETSGLTTVPPALAASLPGFRANPEGGVVPNPEMNAPAVPNPDVSAPDTSSSGINRWWAVPIGLAITAAVGGLLAMLGGRRGRRVTAPTMATSHLDPRRSGNPTMGAAESTMGARRTGMPNTEVRRPNTPSMPNADARGAAMTNTDMRRPNMTNADMRQPNTGNVRPGMTDPATGQWQNPVQGTGGGRHEKRETTRQTPPVDDHMPPLTDGTRPLMGGPQPTSRRDIADAERERLGIRGDTTDPMAGEGVEVVYENNALGANQRSGTDKSAHHKS